MPDSLIHAPAFPLADAVFLHRNDAVAVLALVQAGQLTLNDAWAPSTPGAPASDVFRAFPDTPRFLLWAQAQGPSAAAQPSPDDASWARARQPSPEGESLRLGARNRLLAWAFSDPRAWTAPGGEWAGQVYDTPLDWATQSGNAWALDAALRQPGRPRLPNAWWANALVQATWESHLSILEVLARHSPVPLNDVRAAFGPSLRRLPTVAACAPGTGVPLLHLASQSGIAQYLLDAGVDLLATDDRGQMADQHWRGRGQPGSPDTRQPDGARLNGLLQAFGAAQGRLTPEQALPLQRRQEIHRFVTMTFPEFQAWLIQQPRDLRLGPDAHLPSVVLPALKGSLLTASEMAKRAALLMAHLGPETLDAEGFGDVRERDALWWAVAGGGLKGPVGQLRKAWKDSLRPDAWVDLLPAAARLMARKRGAGFLAETAACLATRGLNAAMGATLEERACLTEMTPTTPGRWDRHDAGGPSLIEQALAIAAMHAGPVDELATLVFVAERWAMEHPRDKHGQPRHGLLDTCLRLTSTQITDAQLGKMAPNRLLRAWEEGAWKSTDPSDGDVRPLVWAAAAHHLHKAGARLDAGTVDVLAARAPASFQPFAARVREAFLAQELAPSTAPSPSPRPRM